MTLDNSVSQSLSALASKIKGFVVGQIGSHNSSSTAHSDIRNSITNLATVATTGSYNDLDDSPEIPKVFYGTSLTAAATKIKEVTTSSNYILSEGTLLIVYFDKYQSNASVQLKVNDEEAIDVLCNNETDIEYKWRSKEVVPFVYNGTNFIMIDSAEATTTYYGVTKLSSSTTSTSTSVAATPSAVKKAYDLANGKANSSHNHVSSNITDLFDAIYPVGSIYMSVNNTSPSTLFGGTWQQLEDTFLYATSDTADTFNTPPTDGTRGEATHTLTINEMPSHNHSNYHQIWNAGSSVSTAGNVVNWAKHATTNLMNIQNTGGGAAHNNMPPYMKVYMWKRTA